MKNSKYAVCLMHFSLSCFFVSCSNSYAQDGLGELIDCTDVSVEYSADSNLTPEERIRLMDKALFQSLNKFELCQSADENENSAEATGDGGSEGAAGSAGGGGASGGDSVASSTMSGTDVAKTAAAAAAAAASSSSSSSSSSAAAINTGNSGGNLSSSNGKLPEDIPPADNDDALAAQIRYAAENEANPVKKEQLWNEYRKYKGLSVKK